MKIIVCTHDGKLCDLDKGACRQNLDWHGQCFKRIEKQIRPSEMPRFEVKEELESSKSSDSLSESPPGSG
jgi:hypothetical protein